MKGTPRRGDVYWVALDPAKGTEIRKTRPAVIVSNDSCNAFGTRVVVLPVTTREALPPVNHSDHAGRIRQLRRALGMA